MDLNTKYKSLDKHLVFLVICSTFYLMGIFDSNPIFCWSHCGPLLAGNLGISLSPLFLCKNLRNNVYHLSTLQGDFHPLATISISFFLCFANFRHEFYPKAFIDHSCSSFSDLCKTFKMASQTIFQNLIWPVLLHYYRILFLLCLFCSLT